jgi:hypothetical protein
MKSFQATAIRICGAATLVVVLIAVVEIGQLVLGMQTLPTLSLSLGLAVLVSFAAFLVANAPRIEVAQGICLSSVAVIAVLLPLYVYKSGLASLGFLDVALALLDLALLAGLCRRVLARRAAAA